MECCEQSMGAEDHERTDEEGDVLLAERRRSSAFGFARRFDLLVEWPRTSRFEPHRGAAVGGNWICSTGLCGGVCSGLEDISAGAQEHRYVALTNAATVAHTKQQHHQKAAPREQSRRSKRR
jgi:hypothetical protein